MILRIVGFGATVAAVLVLLGSLITGVDPGQRMEAHEVLVDPDIPTLDDRIRVEVLNAADINGLARSVTEQLRAEGFDVVYYGNAYSERRDSTTILDRAGNDPAVRAVASALGIDRIEVAIDTTLYLEATVVLGPDWEEQEVERGPE